MPNFSDSSFAILSSPHVGFSRANWQISSRRCFGSAGRPGLRDFHRQNILNALRCHPTKVSGFTITSASRQSKNFAIATIARRNEAVVRRGLVSRSRNKASCFRRNRFSATRATWEEKNSRMNVSNSVFYRNLCAFRPFGSNSCGPGMGRMTRSSKSARMTGIFTFSAAGRPRRKRSGAWRRFVSSTHNPV